MPIAIETQFKSSVTPNPAAVFSPLKFSLTVANYQAVNPQTVFQNPLKQVFVTYSYDGMTDGVQWTAIWYLNGELLKYETSPWEGGTGGSGQYELDLQQEQWLPGIYQLIFYVGTEWKVIGQFLVMGDPPTSTPTLIPSLTRTSSMTPSVTHTPRPTITPMPTDTHWPTVTK